MPFTQRKRGERGQIVYEIVIHINEIVLVFYFYIRNLIVPQMCSNVG